MQSASPLFSSISPTTSPSLEFNQMLDSSWVLTSSMKLPALPSICKVIIPCRVSFILVVKIRSFDLKRFASLIKLTDLFFGITWNFRELGVILATCSSLRATLLNQMYSFAATTFADFYFLNIHRHLSAFIKSGLIQKENLWCSDSQPLQELEVEIHLQLRSEWDKPHERMQNTCENVCSLGFIKCWMVAPKLNKENVFYWIFRYKRYEKANRRPFYLLCLWQTAILEKTEIFITDDFTPAVGEPCQSESGLSTKGFGFCNIFGMSVEMDIQKRNLTRGK